MGRKELRMTTGLCSHYRGRRTPRGRANNLTGVKEMSLGGMELKSRAGDGEPKSAASSG